MSERERFSAARTVERGLRCAILGVFLAGLRRRDPAAAANAALGLAVTYLPDVVDRSSAVRFRPWQRAYLDGAMLAHAVGMLGPYDDTPWWDDATHTLSASIVAGTAYSIARRRGRDPEAPVLAAVSVLGVGWEVLEYATHAIADRLGVEPPLIPYSRRDTAVDLAFNLVGALLVLAFGDRLLGNFAKAD